MLIEKPEHENPPRKLISVRQNCLQAALKGVLMIMMIMMMMLVIMVMVMMIMVMMMMVVMMCSYLSKRRESLFKVFRVP